MPELRGWSVLGAAGLIGLGATLALAQQLPGAAAPAPPIELRPSVDDTTTSGIPADPAAAALSDLVAVEASLSLTRERADALKREIADMQGDRTKQNAALIAAAERVKLAETDIGRMEERIGELIVAELEVRGRLDGADASISTVLAALERISRNPPPALIVNPSDALGSARSALLISAIVPELRRKADQVTADLASLQQIKTDALAEQDRLEANFQILEEEQLRIATLIVARKQNEDQAVASLASEESEAQALADRAGSLKALVDELTRRANAISTAAQATAAANSGGSAPTLDPETIRIALANTDRVEPAVPFAQARGYLQLPSGGVRVLDYGSSDGYGGISRGLSVTTVPQAPVVAPADGWVLFAGDYLNYGKIVIINTGQDYTMLLAGLARIDVREGQFVKMGETLGGMGSRTIGRAVETSAGAQSPTLYIEMRRNNRPVDPTGWWAAPATPTQSG